MNDYNRIRNIFILGYDDLHGRDIVQIPDADRFNFEPLLHSDEVIHQGNLDLEAKLDKARRILREFDRPVDGIVCHWDFPATSMSAILCREFGLPSPSLEAVLKCSHKYWSRLEQHRAVPDNTPAFCAVDPFDDDALEKIPLAYPFWIKPIKGYGSQLGFRINERADFERAIPFVRERIREVGDPFNKILEYLELPEEIRGINGNFLIAEELIGGREIAPEGYVQSGFHVHGVVDMVRGENHKSFLRYEYPSSARKSVQQRAIDIAERFLEHVGFDNGCFNMEFFWKEETDDLWIIEVNPRISQSHCYQFEMVDGMSNHEVAVHVAVGDEPAFEHGNGPHRHAAKFLLRRYDLDNAIVTRVPTGRDLQAVNERQPDTRIRVLVDKGVRLAEDANRDGYSYELAHVHVAGETTHELLEKYREAVELLPFEFRKVPEPEADRAAG